MSREIRTRIAKIGICLILALLASSMTPAQDVTTNSMPGADFTKYHTYKWVTIEGASHPNQIVDAQIKASIDSQLGGERFDQDAERQGRSLHRLSGLR